MEHNKNMAGEEFVQGDVGPDEQARLIRQITEGFRTPGDTAEAQTTAPDPSHDSSNGQPAEKASTEDSESETLPVWKKTDNPNLQRLYVFRDRLSAAQLADGGVGGYWDAARRQSAGTAVVAKELLEYAIPLRPSTDPTPYWSGRAALAAHDIFYDWAWGSGASKESIAATRENLSKLLRDLLAEKPSHLVDMQIRRALFMTFITQTQDESLVLVPAPPEDQIIDSNHVPQLNSYICATMDTGEPVLIPARFPGQTRRPKPGHLILSPHHSALIAIKRLFPADAELLGEIQPGAVRAATINRLVAEMFAKDEKDLTPKERAIRDAAAAQGVWDTRAALESQGYPITVERDTPETSQA